jgi:hypothetical protein
MMFLQFSKNQKGIITIGQANVKFYAATVKNPWYIHALYLQDRVDLVLDTGRNQFPHPDCNNAIQPGIFLGPGFN